MCFDIIKNFKELNCFGWVVEIDLYNLNFILLKCIVFGCFKYENVVLVINNDGYVVVYFGDDECGEYLYKFVFKYCY